METVHENYLIKYYSNVSDIRINIYNRLNGKKYGLTDVDMVGKYKELGIDINECIMQCLTEKKFELCDKDSYITLSFNYLDVVKFQVICKNILCESKEASVLELEMKIKEQDEIIEILESRISDLENGKYLDYYEYCDNKIHKMTRELYFCEFITDGENVFYVLDLSKPCFYRGNNRITTGFNVAPNGNLYRGFHKIQYATQPSLNEIYDSNAGRQKRLIFESEVDISLIPSGIRLEKLGLFNIKLDVSLKYEPIRHIKCLYLHNVTLICTIDKFEKFLSSLSNLEELSVRGCKFITDSTIKCINGLSKLTKIWFAESGIITPSSLRKDIKSV